MGKTKIALCLLLLLVVGCGDHTSTDSRIGDKTAQDYYRQFVYQKDATNPLPYRYLSRSMSTLSSAKGKSGLFYSASLFLLPDGTYAFDYQESRGEIAGSFSKTSNVFKTRITGKWEVQDVRLILSDLGVGAGITYNDQEAVTIKFSRALNAAELVGKTDIFFPTQSNQGMSSDLTLLRNHLN